MSNTFNRLSSSLRGLFSSLTFWVKPEEKIKQRAINLFKKYSPRIQVILGSPDIPDIEFIVSKDLNAPAATTGTTITLNFQYFSEHDDDGAIIHEMAHAIHRCPRYDNETSWLIEGIADYVRDVLGFQTSSSFSHFVKGQALAGYQTTAHFLFWLEEKRSEAVTTLSKYLMDNTYSQDIFPVIFKLTLDDLIMEYESFQS
jgi:hypothetical protein